MIKDIKFKSGKAVDISYPIKLKDSNGNRTYYEDSDGYWSKREYDSNGKRTY